MSSWRRHRHRRSSRRRAARRHPYRRQKRAPADGSGFDRNQTFSAGADFKYGVTSNYTLDGTVNPDFGQVEADPAVLNCRRSRRSSKRSARFSSRAPASTSSPWIAIR